MIDVHLEEIISAIKNGDQGKITILIEKLQPLILSMIKKYGYLSTFEENYQNAMVVLLESIREYDPSREVTFPAFYKKKLFYDFVNILKVQDEAVKFNQNIESLENIPDQLYEKDQNLDNIIWREERLDLHKAINKLTPRQRWIIDQHFFKGKKLTIISEENALHYQSVVKLKSRALKNLKRLLGENFIN